MSNETPQKREEALFEEVLQLDSEAERLGFLKGKCGDDSDLYHRLTDLLKAHVGDENFIRTVERRSDGGAQDSPLLEGPGSTIGRFKLLQQIGEGGMGVVYMAQQEEPVQRKVALKIIKVGMDTKHVVARFEAERQALAMMDHPNIARVLDGGATETGRPYFVMELVRGVPITEYCDKNNLSLNERLGLFMPICRAIHSAHHKGIIHRDIKPSNVLVTLHHGDPMPKVIDFGIAKATNQKLTEKTLFTQYSHMIGTPAYMSPEQAEMSSIDVDTRTDIYSLGVLLYELLTGSTPFSVERLKELAYGELQRVIAEEEPQMPSTRMSTMEISTKEGVAKKRSIDAQALSKHFKGDIDWIVMKCLEKDRRRRYETPSELATDLNRYLHHEPVSAAAPSFVYQLQKLTRRYRTAFAAIAAVLTMFVIGATVATWQAIRATKALHKAETAERATKQALAQESELRKDAEEARQQAEAMRQEANRQLYGSLVDQARLVRLNRKPGFRATMESFLRQAAALDTNAIDELELRNEAIAAMLTPMSGDIVRVMEIPPERTSKLGRFNQPYDEGAFLDEGGELSLYHFDPKGIDSASMILDTEPVLDFGFSYSGQFLVTGHQGGRMRIWERRSATEWVVRREISRSDPGSVVALQLGDIAVGQDGFVVQERGTNRILVWQHFFTPEPEIQQLPEIYDRIGPALTPSISPDGQLLVIPSSANYLVSFWNLRERRVVRKIALSETLTRHGGILQTGFSPNGKYIAVATGAKLRVLDADSLETLYSRDNLGRVMTFCFSADSERFVFGVGQNYILNLDTLTLDESLMGQGGWFVFSGKESGLYQLFPEGHVEYGKVNYLPENSVPLTILAGHSGIVREITFRPGSPVVLSSSFDSSIRMWDLRGINGSSRIIEKSVETPGDIMFTPDQRFFATVVRDDKGSVTIRDANSLEVVQVFELNAPAFGIAFDSSGTRLAVGGEDTVKVWACENAPPGSIDYPYKRDLVYEFHEKGLGWVSEVKFSPDGQFLAFNPKEMPPMATNELLYIIDLKRGLRLPCQIETVSQWRTFDFVSDSQVAIVGTSRDLEIWNIHTGEKEQTIKIFPVQNQMVNLGVSRNGRFVAFSAFQEYLGVYDLELNQTLFCAPSLPEGARASVIRWNAEGSLLGLACNDRKIRILRIPLIRQQLAKLNLDWN